MLKAKVKYILDTVHGTISVPGEYVEHFIDTIEFQRLRRIEQTSARTLYPAARHDRFIHSLGVFYLGSKIVEAIKSNSKGLTSKSEFEKIKRSYIIACLMHDCGHAPFSHTFEKYYGYKRDLIKLLKDEIYDTDFHNDIEQGIGAAEHEMVSGWLLYKKFKDDIIELGGDPILSVRMILGCKYLSSHNDSLRNCFISLLHGNVIDADRLDYVCRDKWASGYSSVSIDLDRLIRAVSIVKENGVYRICYKKSAIHEIQSVLDVKEFQQYNVINHHKVVYDNYLLDKAVDSMVGFMKNSEDDINIAISNFFNPMSFVESQNVYGQNIYLLSDDDIIHLLKKNISSNAFAKEWFSRRHRMIPLWKSYAEYYGLFSTFGVGAISENSRFCKNIENVVNKFLNQRSFGKCLCLKASIKNNTIQPESILIKINDKKVCYTKLCLPHKQYLSDSFFYVYIPKEAKTERGHLLSHLQKYLRNLML